MGKILEWDHALLHFINTTTANSWFDVFFPAITDLHKTLIFNLVIYPLFLGLFYWKYKKNGLVLFVGLLLCLGMTDFSGNIIKQNILRPRPGDTPGVEVTVRSPYGGYSFLSNHAANMFALATYSSFFIPVLKVPTYLAAILTSYSRVYNGVHYPTDVLAGALLGTFWALLFVSGFRKILSRMKKRRT